MPSLIKQQMDAIRELKQNLGPVKLEVITNIKECNNFMRWLGYIDKLSYDMLVFVVQNKNTQHFFDTRGFIYKYGYVCFYKGNYIQSDVKVYDKLFYKMIIERNSLITHLRFQNI
jgi:hypothetical protein